MLFSISQEVIKIQPQSLAFRMLEGVTLAAMPPPRRLNNCRFKCQFLKPHQATIFHYQTKLLQEEY